MDHEHAGDWWCALPDLDGAAPAALMLLAVGSLLASHPSGRAWIVGAQRPGALRTLPLGTARAAVLGECLASDEQFSAAAAAGASRLMALPGSFHAVVASPGSLVAAGDIAGFRRLFTATVHGIPVMASHAGVLRRVLAAPVDRTWLACRLASPEMPSALRNTLTPFVGVASVPGGHFARIDGTRCEVTRWWAPPSGQLSVAEGAAGLREALVMAVAGRVARYGGPVSVQLSGGLDSTALAALAYPARPLLITTAGRSPVDDDAAWAGRTAGLLPGCPHQVIRPDEAPLFFSDLDSPPATDEPAPFTAGAARQRYAAAILASHGTRLHLNGQGGDEVLLAPPAYLSSALRSAPYTAWRHVRGHAALQGVAGAALARTLLRPGSYATWLRRSASTLRTKPSAAQYLTDWEARPMLPPWATPEAEELVASAIRNADTTPSAEDLPTHATLARIRASAYRAALYRDAMATAGVPTAMPFLDRAVVEACLLVRPWERTNPWQPKPLLRAALAEIAPAGLPSRRTKGTYNADIHHGWTAHRDQVAAFLARPWLAGHGLIDVDRLSRSVATFGPGMIPPAWITDLIAIEAWLRHIDHEPALPPAHSLRTGMRALPRNREKLLDAQPVRLPPGVRATSVDDGMTLLDTERGMLFHVNRTAAAVLATLVAGRDAAEGKNVAVSMLMARYDVSAEQAAADIAALLGQLYDRGLLAQPEPGN